MIKQVITVGLADFLDGCLRDMTLTTAYSMSDVNTKMRQTIIQMSMALM